MEDIEKWSVQKSSSIYGFDYWGSGYFRVNERGNISVTPDGNGGPSADLLEIINAVKQRGLELPVVLRFNGIINHRIRLLNDVFNNAIKEHDYQGRYFPAYPIKVNQQRHIVEVLRRAGQPYSIGIEVGSKPELIAALGIHDEPDSLLLCNGYKDAEYIELALMAKKVGRRPIIVIEKPNELELVRRVSEKLGVDPEIGFRLRLSGRGAGRWEKSGGDRAKFGLTIGEIIAAVNDLRSTNQLSMVRMLHFHLGSQITSINSLKEALREGVQVYAQLRKRCPNLTVFDVGGGLGVDYDGSKTAFESSMNYTVDEYARDVVWVIRKVCEQAHVPHPDIVTESGRALVAHQSVLIFNVLGVANSFSRKVNPAEVSKNTSHATVQAMAELMLELSPKNCHEALHDAVSLRNEILQQFNLGLMSIEDRALADECYWALLNEIVRLSKDLYYVPEDLTLIPGNLTDSYVCNFSIFQSMPDSWAIQQIFPIAPIHRLQEKPTVNVVLADLTCDSDGKIDRFPDLREVKRYLPVHPLRNGDPYYLAAFLVGAYQDILGDLHNLFGDTNAVHVEVGEDGKFYFTNVVRGNRVQEVLNYVQFDRNDLCERWERSVSRIVTEGKLSPEESQHLVERYRKSFDGYTYLVS